METTNARDAVKTLITEIQNATDDAPVAALKSDFINRDGWSDLVESDAVNCWSDDFGNEYVEIGCQL